MIYPMFEEKNLVLFEEFRAFGFPQADAMLYAIHGISFEDVLRYVGVGITNAEDIVALHKNRIEPEKVAHYQKLGVRDVRYILTFHRNWLKPELLEKLRKFLTWESEEDLRALLVLERYIQERELWENIKEGEKPRAIELVRRLVGTGVLGREVDTLLSFAITLFGVFLSLVSSVLDRSGVWSSAVFLAYIFLGFIPMFCEGCRMHIKPLRRLVQGPLWRLTKGLVLKWARPWV